MPTQERYPSSDITATGTWSGTAGSRYTLVEDYPDDNIDFLQHGTTAGAILFGFSAFSIPSNATGITLRMNYYDQEGTSGVNNIAGRLRLSAAVYTATNHNPGTTTTLRTDTWSTNPATSAAWTPAQINGTDGTNPLNAFGFASTDANPAIRIYSVELQVEYTVSATGRSYGFIIG